MGLNVRSLKILEKLRQAGVAVNFVSTKVVLEKIPLSLNPASAPHSVYLWTKDSKTIWITAGLDPILTEIVLFHEAYHALDPHLDRAFASKLPYSVVLVAAEHRAYRAQIDYCNALSQKSWSFRRTYTRLVKNGALIGEIPNLNDLASAYFSEAPRIAA